MKKKFLLFSSILLILILFCGQSWATSITNTANDGFEDYANGETFDYYQNSGTLIGVYSGNDNKLSEIQEDINNWYNENIGTGTITITTESLTLSTTGWNGSNLIDVDTPEEDKDYKVDNIISDYLSGTWAAFYSDSDDQYAEISFYVVKASTAYAIYWVNPAASEGSWSVFDIYKYLDDAENNGVVSISHFTGVFATGFNTNEAASPNPEPSTFFLFGTGLLGIAKISRRKIISRYKHI